MSIKKEVYDFTELVNDNFSGTEKNIILALYTLIETGYRIPYRESLMNTAREIVMNNLIKQNKIKQ